MKINFTKTLPNGTTEQITSVKEVGIPVKIAAQPGVKLDIKIESGVESKKGASAKSTLHRSGNDMIVEEDGEAIVQVVDFYAVDGASLSGVEWNYTGSVGQDAVVVAGNESASTTAAISGSEGTSDLSPQLGLGTLLLTGGAVGLAAAGSGGGGAVAINVVTGVITAGPVVPGHGLSVVIYKADGTLINGTQAASTATVDATGHFTLNVGTYTGVVIAKVVDSGTQTDYKDEATTQDKDLTATLMAVGILTSTGTTLKLNINPLTAVAAQKAGLNADGTGSVASATAATDANSAVAMAFGLSDITATEPDTTNDTNSTNNALGRVLAVLSGMDQANAGDMQTTINQLVNNTTGVIQTGTHGELASALQMALYNAAVIADPSGTLGLAQAAAPQIVNALTTISTAALNNSATDTNPTAADYTAAGITGVTSTNLAAINSALVKACPACMDRAIRSRTSGKCDSIWTIRCWRLYWRNHRGMARLSNMSHPIQTLPKPSANPIPHIPNGSAQTMRQQSVMLKGSPVCCKYLFHARLAGSWRKKFSSQMCWPNKRFDCNSGAEDGSLRVDSDCHRRSRVLRSLPMTPRRTA